MSEHTQEQCRPWQLLLLSAKTESALETATQNLAQHLRQHPELNLADVAYTLQIGRRVFNHRRVVVCENLEDATDHIKNTKAAKSFNSFPRTN